MTINTYTPGTVSASQWTATGGGALNDGSDGTYYTTNSTQINTLLTISNWSPTIIGSTSPTKVITGIQIQIRYRLVGGVTSPCKVTVWLENSNGARLPLALTFTSTSVVNNVSGIVYYAPSGRLWTETELNSIVLKIRAQTTLDGTTALDNIIVYDVKMYQVVNNLPTPSSVTLLPDIYTYAAPILTWTYSDTDGDAQYKYRVKVFNFATVSSTSYAGFDPDDSQYSSLAVYDSGEVISSNTSHQIGLLAGTSLPNVQYTAFVKVADINNVWGPWVKSSIVVNPYGAIAGFITCTPTVDNANNRVSLALQGGLNLLDDRTQFIASDHDWTTLSNCSVAAETSLVLAGGYNTIKQTATAAATMTAATSATYEVAPSTSYYAAAYVRTAVTARTVRIDVDWYTSAAAFISTSTLATGTDSTSYAQISGTATSPVNAALAVVKLVVVSPANTEIHYWGAPHFSPSNSQAVASTHACYGGLSPRRNKLSGDDSSFESALNWASFNGNATLARTNLGGGAALGSYVMQITCTSTASEAVAYSPLYTALAGQSYTVQARIKTAASVANANIGIAWYDINKRLLATTRASTPLGATTSYQTATHTATAPTGTAYASVLAIVDATTQTLYYDLIQFVLGAGVGVMHVGRQAFAGEHWINIERSEDSGATWTPIYGSRSMNSLEPSLYSFTNAAQTLTVIDYGARPNTATLYRASLGARNQSRYLAGSVYSTSPTTYTVAPTDPKAWFLKDVVTGTSLAVDIIGDTFDETVPEDQATYHPIGRSTTVVISDVIRSSTFPITFDFISSANLATFKTLRGYQRALLLQNSWTNQQWFIRFKEEVKYSTMNTNPARTLVECRVEVVDVPTF